MTGTISVIMRPRRVVSVALATEGGARIMSVEKKPDALHVALQVGGRTPTTILDPRAAVTLTQQRVIAGKQGEPGPPGPPGPPGSGTSLPDILDGGNY